jgi:transaldolase
VTELRELADLGQAVWLDYIRRSFIASGELQALIDQGVTGVTSNPTIFEKAIAGSTDYDDALHRLVDAGKNAEEIYEALVLEDIQQATDVLHPVYERTEGADGYVSLEASPKLAHDTEGTIAEAQYLFAALNRPNVMIKVPATPAGIPAIETLIGDGINVNVTLMFSLAQYEAVSNAYIAGLEKLAESGGDVTCVASVASFFVSRVDTAVDRALEEIGETELQGKIAVANAKVVYALFQEIFSGSRWEHLANLGARVQRPLWASTSTKNLLYADTLYVDGLIGPHTVNTLPPATLQAFLDHGRAAPTLDASLQQAHAQLEQLSDLGVDLDAITRRLLDDGVATFARSFDALMASIKEKCERLRAGWRHQSAALGAYQPTVDSALHEMAEKRIIKRIWAHDYTVWKPKPKEITDRLGWLRTADVMSDNVHRLDTFAAGSSYAG